MQCPGPAREGGTSCATRLLHLNPGMLVLWDRGFDGNGFLAAGARVVGRISQRRRPRVLQPLRDSLYLPVTGGVAVRIIGAGICAACADGSGSDGSCRLETPLDAQRCPAGRPVRLCHERREHESACCALRHTILNG